MRILLVEDDHATQLAVTDLLQSQSYYVDCASDGEMALQLTEQTFYDLIVLDIGLPKLDGLQLCNQWRSSSYPSPILLLTAQSSTHDRVIGLDAGADDYLTKPFEAEEFLARVRVLLRRKTSIARSVVTWQTIRLDTIAGTVTCNAQPVSLTQKEFHLLELFLTHPNRTFSRSVILDRLWTDAEFPGEETISTHVKCIRQKLKAVGGNDPIETVHGLGYRLRSQIPLEKIQSKTAALWQRFEASFLEQIQTLEQTLQSRPLSTTHRQTAKNIAHKLAGSLGIFGFMESSRIAKALEDNLQTEQQEQAIDLVQQLRRSLHSPSDVPLPTILIVDDDRAVLERLTTLLTPLELRVITIEQPEQLWQNLTEAQPTLLLLDIEMPKINGLEICQTVRRDPQWQNLAIVLLSSESEAQILDRVRAAGANDYVNKLAPATEILSRILQQIGVKK